MRTTVDVPADLMRAAKMAAADRGISLKELFIRALSQEVGGSTGTPGGRVVFPLVGARGATPRVDVTYPEIEAAFDAEEAARYTS
ncbi:hypothetical protein [Gordonia sp. (in: high G+C Gram-positive bacteria)]|uniref:hypothetical protein n=1 Tax=Gordonia sp. (in: high G+C Gram-positive bacteria) TaxID=84139 RepID=UPI0039E310E1